MTRERRYNFVRNHQYPYTPLSDDSALTQLRMIDAATPGLATMRSNSAAGDNRRLGSPADAGYLPCASFGVIGPSRSHPTLFHPSEAVRRRAATGRIRRPSVEAQMQGTGMMKLWRTLEVLLPRSESQCSAMRPSEAFSKGSGLMGRVDSVRALAVRTPRVLNRFRLAPTDGAERRSFSQPCMRRFER